MQNFGLAAIRRTVSFIMTASRWQRTFLRAAN